MIRKIIQSEYLILIPVPGLAFYVAFIPHISYPYALRVDEWVLIARANAMALAIKEVVGFKGDLVFDETRPDGMPRKLLDTGKITGLGWSPKTSLSNGIRQTYEWFLSRNIK
jgi:hypothetical protein